MTTFSVACATALIFASHAGQCDAQEPPATQNPTKVVALKDYPLRKKFADAGVCPAATIRVLVSGQVRKPDFYDLALDAKVSDAIERAGGVTRLSTWTYSYLLRPRNEEQALMIKFRNKTKAADMEISIRDGDRIYISEILD